MNYSSTTYELACNQCGKRYGNQPLSACPDCLVPLEVVYDLLSARGVFTRDSIARGPASIWRYARLLPVPEGFQSDVPVGFTPLIRAKRLGRRIGASNLYIKSDATCFPTLSFIDRPVAIALANALRFGFDTVGCSIGNLANAVAAQAARLGLKTCILVPANMAPSKILNSLVYGARLIRVDGDSEQLIHLSTLIAEEYKWGFVNVNLRPYYAEGAKTVGYEIAEQLGWRLPDNVVVPMGDGSLVCKIRKAFNELIFLGLVKKPVRPVRFFGAQASAYLPKSVQIEENSNSIAPRLSNTIDRSLSLGDLAGRKTVVKMILADGGWVEDVSDMETYSGIRDLAETEGIFSDTLGGGVTAVTERLYSGGRIPSEETTILCITGNGQQAEDAFAGHFPYLEGAVVSPRLADFKSYLRLLDATPEPELVAADKP